MQTISKEYETMLWSKSACGRHKDMWQETCQHCLKNFENLKELAENGIALQEQIKKLQTSLDEELDLRKHLADLLYKIANAVHGQPIENNQWPWYDLPALVTNLKQELKYYSAPIPQNPLCRGNGNCAGVCGACMEITTNLEFRLAHKLLEMENQTKLSKDALV